ncbi:MAG: DMT family transporter [Alistipes sp.]|jgi:drug/metabolite transporter (DMT)-like permease|nr:DMT family transporter [Alistipes sp.]
MRFTEKNYRGHLLMVIAYTVFGLNIPAVKYVIGEAGITGLSVTFYRMAGAAALFWFASLFVRAQRVPPRDLGAIFVASLFCILLNQMPFIVGVSLTSPIDASVITTIGPMITMVLAAAFLHEPISWLKAGGVVVGASGALMLVLGGGALEGRGGASVVGDLLCVASSLSFAIYLTAFKRLFTTYSPVTLMRWMFLFSAVLSAPVCWHDVATVDYVSLGWDVWATIFFIVAGATFLTFFLLPIGQRYLRPTVLSMYNYLQPTVAALVAVAAGMDTFGLTKGLATVLVFAGVWMVTRSKSRASVSGAQLPE